MNYKESPAILEEIKKAKRILVNLHQGPDPDSFASAFALYYFLISLDKEVDITLTTNSRIATDLLPLEEIKLVKSVDYSNLDFSEYDLLISPDSGQWQQVVNNQSVDVPKIPIVVIDHHENQMFGKINIIDTSAASCSQMIYLFLKDCNFEIDKKVADLLMLGIISDTGGFSFSNNIQVMEVATELMKLGADKEKIMSKLFRTKKFEILKVWGEFFTRMEIDKKHKFVWTTLPYKIDRKYGHVSSNFSTMFINIVEGTDFGIVMTEQEEGSLYLSFRSRSKVNVAKLAEKLGGGGHKVSSGGIITGMPFDKAVDFVLETTRKYVEEN